MTQPAPEITQAQALHRDAIQQLTAGQLDAGIALLKKALALAPNASVVHNDLGTAYWQSGKAKDAETHYRKALQLAPQNPHVLNNYGAFLIEQRRLTEAGPLLQRAMEILPGHYEIPNNLGLWHYRSGNLPEAEKLFEQSIRLNPRWPNAFGNLASLLRDTDRLGDAEKAYHHALKRDQNNAVAWSGLGQVYFSQGREDVALECLKRSLSIDPSHEISWLRLLGHFEKTSRTEEAFETLKEIKQRFPNSPGAITHEAKLLRRSGDLDGAIALLERGARALQDKSQRNHPFVIELYFELGQLYDLKGDAAKAFPCFVTANKGQAESREGLRYAGDVFSREIARIRSEFTADNASGPLPATEASGPVPVFLIGFPRSGTTLLDQILSSHPDIAVAEEKPAVDEMARYLRVARGDGQKPGDDDPAYVSCLLEAGADDVAEMRRIFFAEHARHSDFAGKKLLIDKLPLNILHAGLIHRVFPEAKFILALRHPCDSVLSCFMQHFKLNHAMARFLDLKDAATFYSETFGLWDHYVETLRPVAHEIRYEDVVSDFRPTVESLLRFLDVPWNDAVLEYDKTAREKSRIDTPSYRQVTEKIYTRASGRWQRYRQQMKPAMDILAPHAERLGYSMDE